MVAGLVFISTTIDSIVHGIACWWCPIFPSISTTTATANTIVHLAKVKRRHMKGTVVPLGQALEPRIATLVYADKMERPRWQIRFQGTQVTTDGIVRLFVPSVRGLDLLALVGWVAAKISWSAIRQEDHHRRMRRVVAAHNALPQQLEAVAKVRSQSGGVARLGLGEEGQTLVGGAIAKYPLGLVVPKDEREVNPLALLQFDEVGGGGKHRIVPGHHHHSCRLIIVGSSIGSTSFATSARSCNVHAVHGAAPIDAQVDMGEGLAAFGGIRFESLGVNNSVTGRTRGAVACPVGIRGGSFERGNGGHSAFEGRLELLHYSTLSLSLGGLVWIRLV